MTSIVHLHNLSDPTENLLIRPQAIPFALALNPSSATFLASPLEYRFLLLSAPWGFS